MEEYVVNVLLGGYLSPREHQLESTQRVLVNSKFDLAEKSSTKVVGDFDQSWSPGT